MRESLRTAILDETNAAKALADAAIREERQMTDVERGEMEKRLGQAETLLEQAKSEEALSKRAAALTDGLALHTDPATGAERGAGIYEAAKADAAPAKGRARKSLGTRFVESPEYKALLSAAPGGHFGEMARVHGQPVAVKDLLTGGDHATSAGALVEPDYRGMLDPFYQRPMTLRQLFGAAQTGSDTIEYVRLVTATNAAAPVAEATSAAPIDGTIVTPVAGGLKPESGLEFERDSTNVKTIAHWLPATKRALADAAQIRSLIDSFLLYGLEEELESQVITGNGVGENFEGLVNTSGVQVAGPPLAGEDILDVTRRARRMVQVGGRATPTAYAMHPLDWENIELMRTTAGEFYGLGPFAMTAPRLWGLPVVESEAIPAGTPYCAAWNWAVIYDREQGQVQASDAHADYFVRNLVAILGEMRAAFAVLRPPAFVRCLTA